MFIQHYTFLPHQGKFSLLPLKGILHPLNNLIKVYTGAEKKSNASITFYTKSNLLSTTK